VAVTGQLPLPAFGRVARGRAETATVVHDHHRGEGTVPRGTRDRDRDAVRRGAGRAGLRGAGGGDGAASGEEQRGHNEAERRLTGVHGGEIVVRPGGNP